MTARWNDAYARLAAVLTVGYLLVAGALLAVPLAAVLPLDRAPGGPAGGLLYAGLAVTAALAVWVLRDVTARSRPHRPTAVVDSAAEERRLHGAFRPQSRPDAPGRPRPRAPGGVRRPA